MSNFDNELRHLLEAASRRGDDLGTAALKVGDEIVELLTTPALMGSFFRAALDAVGKDTPNERLLRVAALVIYNRAGGILAKQITLLSDDLRPGHDRALAEIVEKAKDKSGILAYQAAVAAAELAAIEAAAAPKVAPPPVEAPKVVVAKVAPSAVPASPTGYGAMPDAKPKSVEALFPDGFGFFDDEPKAAPIAAAPKAGYGISEPSAPKSVEALFPDGFGFFDEDEPKAPPVKTEVEPSSNLMAILSWATLHASLQKPLQARLDTIAARLSDSELTAGQISILSEAGSVLATATWGAKDQGLQPIPTERGGLGQAVLSIPASFASSPVISASVRPILAILVRSEAPI